MNDEPSTTPPPARRAEPDEPDEGGDPACWLDLVCDVCGRVRERGTDHDHGGGAAAPQ